MRKFDYNLIGELITKYIYVSVNNESYYTSTIVVGSVQMKLTCAYNSLNKQRWISIADSYGNVLLPQTFLKYGRRCELNFNAEMSDLSYYVTLSPKDITKVRHFTDDYDYLDWSKDFRLCFVGMSQSLIERLNDNGFIFLTSG
mgnify:FL=1